MNPDDDLVDCSSKLPFDGAPDQFALEDCLWLRLLVAAWQRCSPFGSGSSSAIGLQFNSDPIAILLELVSRLTRTSWQHWVPYFNSVGL